MLRDWYRFYFSPDDSGAGSGTGGSESGDSGGSAAASGEPKMVPESDLMAVKSSFEGAQQELAQVKGDLAEKVSALDLRFGELNTAKTRHQELEAKIATLQTSASEVDKLKEDLAASNKGREELTKQVVESKRAALVATRGYKPEDLDEFGLPELTVLEKALAKLPTNQVLAGAARGGGSMGSQDGRAGTSALAKMKEGFNQR